MFARVIVHEPSFLTGLDAFWAEADLADLKLWARVHMILGFASSLSRDFDTTNFDFYEGALRCQEAARSLEARGEPGQRHLW